MMNNNTIVLETQFESYLQCVAVLKHQLQQIRSSSVPNALIFAAKNYLISKQLQNFGMNKRRSVHEMQFGLVCTVFQSQNINYTK